MAEELSERELIERVIAGDTVARNLFVTRYGRFVRAVVMHAVQRFGSAVEEIPQEVFLRLFECDCRRLRQWRGEGDFVSWLAPIVRNATWDFMEDRYGNRPEQFPDPNEGDSWEPADPAPCSDEALVELEQTEILMELMEQLGERDRAILSMHFVEGEPAPELARRLGIEVNAVYQRLHRALRRLERLARASYPDLFVAEPPVETGSSESSREH